MQIHPPKICMHAKGLTAIITSMCLFNCLTQQSRVWRERRRKEVWGVIVLVFENLLFLPANAKKSEFLVNFKFTFNKNTNKKLPTQKPHGFPQDNPAPIPRTHRFFPKTTSQKNQLRMSNQFGWARRRCRLFSMQIRASKSPGNSPENPPELRRLSAEAGRLGRLLPLEGREMMSCREGMV